MPVDEIYRPSSREDIPELNRLFAEVFGEERDEAVWRWKYFDNPRGAHTFLCEAGGKIVAHCGGTPVIVRDGPSRYVALQSVDFMSTRKHPGALGRGGVFYKVVQAFFDAYCGPEKASMVYGFPGERHRLVGEKILGYRPIEPVGELLFRAEAASGALDAEPLDGYLALLSQTSTDFGGVRDRTYIDWRYLRHPKHRYAAVAVSRWPWRGAGLVAVIRELEDEVLVMEPEGDYSERPLQKLVRHLGSSGKPVRMWASLAHPRTASLRRAGFITSERDHRVEARFFFDRAVPSPGELYYSLGDYDVF